MNIYIFFSFRSPDKCDSKIITVTDSLPIFYIDVKKSEKEVSGSSCLALSYTPDSKLTEMLSVVSIFFFLIMYQYFLLNPKGLSSKKTPKTEGRY